MELKFVNKLDPVLKKELREKVYEILGCCQDVHRELGPWLNEYTYQDALHIALEEKGIKCVPEFYFQVFFHGKQLNHKHFVDFKCGDDIFVECKAIESLGSEQRQQLWNYMRLSKTPIGILYNFAPTKDQCEKYYYDSKTKCITAF